MSMLFELNLSSSLGVIFLISCILLIIMHGAINEKVYEGYEHTSNNNMVDIRNLSIFSLVVLTLIIGWCPFTDVTLFNNLLHTNGLTKLVIMMLLLGTLSVLLMINVQRYEDSIFYIRSKKIVNYIYIPFEFPIIVLICLLGVILLVSAYDLISLYLALELQALGLYVLAGLNRNSEFSTEAALKYFILGAISSGVLLFGIMTIYISSGLTNFNDLILFNFGQNTGLSSIYDIGLIFILITLLFKLGNAPFHIWVPDVYEGSPAYATAFFAIVPKIAILGVLIEVLVLQTPTSWIIIQNALIISSILSMLIGGLGGLLQKKVMRFISYSAIANMGYVLIGICSGTNNGILSSLIYMIVYISISIVVFAVILNTSNQLTSVKYITQFEGFHKINKPVAFIFAMSLLSFAGMPPLAGFYGKFMVLNSAITSSLYLLAVVAVLASIMGAFYYLRIVKTMYFEPAETEIVNVVEINPNQIQQTQNQGKLKCIYSYSEHLKKDNIGVVVSYILVIGTLFNLLFGLLVQTYTKLIVIGIHQ